MIRYLFASHGPLASGMAESVTFIAGKDKHIDTICAYMDPGVALVQQIEDIFNTYDSNDEIIVLTDLYGGSVNNEFINLLQKRKFYLVAGMSMALAIQMLMILDENDLETGIKNAVNEGSSSVIYCNDLIKKDNVEEDF